MKKTVTCALVLLALVGLHRLDAQAPQPARPAGATAEQKPPAEDPLGRSTPHGTVSGLLAAAGQGNLDRAAEYLDSALRSPERRELAKKLQLVLDRKLFTNLDRVSDEPEGTLDDGLAGRDRIGLVESPSGNVEMFLDRVERAPGNPIWLFSSGTLQEIPRLYEELQPPWIERYLPDRLRLLEWRSVPLYRWLAIVLLIPLIFGSAALATRALTWLLRRSIPRLRPEQTDGQPVSVGPLRLLMLSLCFYAASLVGLSLAGRHFWQRVAETLMTVALCWLSLRLLDLLTEVTLDHLQRVHRSGDTALVRLVNRLLKAAAVIVAVLVLLYLSDVDLTAALTGLGVGGLAIGFGAQRTIENLFGGMMVISDKPVNVGDVCKVGEFFGTVEDIGIRSTRIRTLDRTVVSVPNGQLASMSLENFATRDRMRFHHTVGLLRETSADQLREVLARIRRLLDAHPRVDPTSARTRFIRFGAWSLDLEIFAYVVETDPLVFLAIQEELLLGILDIIEPSEAASAERVRAADLAKDRGQQAFGLMP